MNRKALSKRLVAMVTLATVLNSTVAMAGELNKNETVYVTLNGDGQVKERIVSDWISSDENLGSFSDKSDLKDIKNVKGEETPEIDGESVKWNIGSKDLYYKGESDRDLPLDIKIKYEIDGKEISPEEIAGKSGKFKMTLSIKNNQSKVVNINGEDRTIYVPFTSAAALVLPKDNFDNVKINLGKVLDDGNNTAVTFITVPGLKESLDVDLDDELTLEANVKNFKLPPIMVTSTPEVPELDKLEEYKNLDELLDSLNKLQDGGQQLIDGSGKLLDGQTELNNNYKNFNDGVGTLNNGAKELKGGIDALGANTPKLRDGAGKINGGLKQLLDSEKKFNDGVSTFVDSTGKLYDAHNALDGGIDKCLGGVKQLKQGSGQMVQGLDKLADSTQNLDGLSAQLGQMSQALAKANPELSAKLQAASKGLSQVSQGQKAGIGALKNGAQAGANGLSQVESGLTEVSKGSKTYGEKFSKLVKAGGSLKENSKKIVGAVDQLYSGSNELVNGTNALNEGAKKLILGSTTLANGTQSLNENSNKILNGTEELKKGGSDLKEGINKFKAEGLDKLKNEGDKGINEIKDLFELKDEIKKASEEYNTFSGITEGMEGKVKFVMRTDEIKLENQKNNEPKKKAVKENKDGEKGFLDKLKNLF